MKKEHLIKKRLCFNTINLVYFEFSNIICVCYLLFLKVLNFDGTVNISKLCVVTCVVF